MGGAHLHLSTPHVGYNWGGSRWAPLVVSHGQGGERMLRAENPPRLMNYIMQNILTSKKKSGSSINSNRMWMKNDGKVSDLDISSTPQTNIKTWHSSKTISLMLPKPQYNSIARFQPPFFDCGISFIKLNVRRVSHYLQAISGATS